MRGCFAEATIVSSARGHQGQVYWNRCGWQQNGSTCSTGSQRGQIDEQRTVKRLLLLPVAVGGSDNKPAKSAQKQQHRIKSPLRLLYALPETEFRRHPERERLSILGESLFEVIQMVEEQSANIGRDAQLAMLQQDKWQAEIERAVDKVKLAVELSRLWRQIFTA